MPNGEMAQSQTLSSCIDARLSRVRACRAATRAPSPAASTAPGRAARSAARRPVVLADVADQLAQRVVLRAAQLVALRRCVASSSSARAKQSRDVADVDRLESRVRRARARSPAAMRDELREQVEERSSRPKITDGRKIVQRVRRGDDRLGLALGAQVLAGPPDRRSSALMCSSRATPAAWQASTTLARQARRARARTCRVRARCSMPTRLIDRVAPRSEPRERRRRRWTSASTTSTVGSRIRCLARSRRRVGTIDACPAADEPRDDVAADEAAAAEHEDRARRPSAHSATRRGRRRRRRSTTAPRGATVPSRCVSGTYGLIERAARRTSCSRALSSRSRASR